MESTIKNNYFSGCQKEASILINLFRFVIRSKTGRVHRPFEFEMKNRRLLPFKDYGLMMTINLGERNIHHFSKRDNQEISTECRVIHHAGVLCNQLQTLEMNNIKEISMTIFKETQENSHNAVCVSSKYCDKILLKPSGVSVADNQQINFLHYHKLISEST